jgi:hypothetical protein
MELNWVGIEVEEIVKKFFSLLPNFFSKAFLVFWIWWVWMKLVTKHKKKRKAKKKQPRQLRRQRLDAWSGDSSSPTVVAKILRCCITIGVLKKTSSSYSISSPPDEIQWIGCFENLRHILFHHAKWSNELGVYKHFFIFFYFVTTNESNELGVLKNFVILFFITTMIQWIGCL